MLYITNIFLIRHTGLFVVNFRLFKQRLQFLQQINVKQVRPVRGAGIQTSEYVALLP